MHLTLAPYCNELQQRQKYLNLPQWVHIHAGKDAWSRAKHHNARNGDCISSVWSGEAHRWPVGGCFCRVEIDRGPSVDQCKAFARDLLKSGAVLVLLWWLDRDDGMPLVYHHDGHHAELDLDDLRHVFGGAS